MDAVEFLKVRKRMCKMYSPWCNDCPLFNNAKNNYSTCRAYEEENPKEVVEIVKNWSKYPMKTRQSEFLKMFPIANPSDIDPCNIDTSLATDKRCKNIDCDSCRREFWNEEVDDDK